jgi:glycosyltransferase involved in cell wall biosynthesis
VEREPSMSFRHPAAPRDAGLELSVVLPVHNEEGNLPALWEELVAALAAIGRPAEVIFVNDGSTDGSGAWLDRTRAADARVRVLDHDGNHGLTAALDTGFRAARGAVIAMLDADLQNPPAELAKLLARLPEADMVIGWRKDRRDPFVKRITSRIANAYRNWKTHEQVHDTGCALKVFRREVIERIKMWKGMHRFLPTLARIEGFRVVEVPVAHRPRGSGKSHFGTWNRLWKGIADVRAVRWMWSRRIAARSTERGAPATERGA